MVTEMRPGWVVMVQWLLLHGNLTATSNLGHLPSPRWWAELPHTPWPFLSQEPLLACPLPHPVTPSLGSRCTDHLSFLSNRALQVLLLPGTCPTSFLLGHSSPLLKPCSAVISSGKPSLGHWPHSPRTFLLLFAGTSTNKE